MTESPRQVSSYTLEQMGAWIELFYDLVFVAAILVFSSAVSHLHDADRIQLFRFGLRLTLPVGG